MSLGGFDSHHVSTRPRFVDIRQNLILIFFAFETCCIVLIRSASQYCGEYFMYLQFQSTAHDFTSNFFCKSEKSL